MCSSEQVAEGVVQQVDEGGGVQVSVAHHLGGEQGLPGAAAEEATHHAVAHVHVVCDFLNHQRREEEDLASCQSYCPPDPDGCTIVIGGKSQHFHHQEL